MAISSRSGGAPALLFIVALLCSGRSVAEDPAAPLVLEIGEVVIATPAGEQGAPAPLYTESQLRSWLEGFVGDPFDEHDVRRRIARHYEYLGYVPSVRIALEQGRLDLRVDEAPGVAEEITLGPDALRGRVDPALIEGLERIERPHVLTRALRTREGDLLNHERLARDEYDLSRLGFDIVPIPPPHDETGEARVGGAAAAPPAPGAALTGRFAVVRCPRLEEWREVRDRMRAGNTATEADDEAAGGLEPPGSDRRTNPQEEPGGAWSREPSSSQRTGSSPASEGIRPPIEPLRLGWLSTEAEYTRRSLFVARLFYERTNLLREYDSLEISPYVAQQLAGALRYRLPYILPAWVTEWNLFADVKLYDEFVPDRLLDGVETDERRAGAKVAMGIEPFVDRRGHTLRGTAWVDRYHVTFGEFQIPVNGGIAPRSANVPGGSLNDVNLLGIEMSWAYHHEFRPPRFWWQLLPRAELATKALGGDIAFRRASAELRQHYAWSPGLELDMSWKGGVVDRDVPVFEEFALGGATSLRGFLRDDFLGRRSWSAQNDLWVPIPFRALAPESKLMGALQRNLKTALIFDAGSVSFEETLDVRFARGTGVGLRWQAEGSPLVVRIDAAWGFWRGERSFYPYLSFTRSW